ncbi:hypothetical protein WICPIJ_005648 [Wickerhamomyces pijperi]|uniref:Uncharacterized protein n=1 Tax=Wickerhamomyces pijperi TaxID=599730 RepID=A0A9P8TM54_WICPI|nr:hypothetical protein WICPIJ_005648 [Wickerhamomyces pijperi]
MDNPHNMFLDKSFKDSSSMSSKTTTNKAVSMILKILKLVSSSIKLDLKLAQFFLFSVVKTPNEDLAICEGVDFIESSKIDWKLMLNSSSVKIKLFSLSKTSNQ